MKNKYYKKDDKLVIEIPLRTERSNPYDNNYSAPMNNLIGFINVSGEYGFAHLIDMEYKGKDDQWTDILYYFVGSQIEFEKLCKELNIDIVKE